MRLVTFGCSLSKQNSNSVNNPNWVNKPTGLVHHLADMLGVEYLNYAASAGSNYLSLERFNNYFLTQYHPDDIILFQLTSVRRNGFSYRPRYEDKLQKEESADFTGKSDYIWTEDDSWIKIKGSENTHNIHLLCNNELANIQEDSIGLPNPNTQFSQIVTTLSLLRKIHPRMLVWLGWRRALEHDSKADLYNFYRKEFAKNDITFVEQPYLEWVLENHLPILDDLHPNPERSGKIYAEKVLFPYIKKML